LNYLNRDKTDYEVKEDEEEHVNDKEDGESQIPDDVIDHPELKEENNEERGIKEDSKSDLQEENDLLIDMIDDEGEEKRESLYGYNLRSMRSRDYSHQFTLLSV
jgi:hypothetical protein